LIDLKKCSKPLKNNGDVAVGLNYRSNIKKQTSRNWYPFRPPVIPLNESKGKAPEDKSGSWIVRNIPCSLIKKATITDMVESEPKLRLS